MITSDKIANILFSVFNKIPPFNKINADRISPTGVTN